MHYICELSITISARLRYVPPWAQELFTTFVAKVKSVVETPDTAVRAQLKGGVGCSKGGSVRCREVVLSRALADVQGAYSKNSELRLALLLRESKIY